MNDPSVEALRTIEALRQRDTARVERDDAYTDRNRYITERDAAYAERDAAYADHDPGDELYEQISTYLRFHAPRGDDIADKAADEAEALQLRDTLRQLLLEWKSNRETT